ncbi:HD domain-containing protein [Labilibacter marinus]|uniref:HD domain-containing protein n=1 Tax=Labilibacter marinus TaxID=1477105 RepID=UPI001E5E8BE0|nr:HD domain-containing protein [Labilibacter marinus]
MNKSNIVNKLKIINDPVYGFVKIPFDFIYDLLQHPYFQRLRGIKQLGLTSLVYPGATHNRFQHAVGAMHLMSQAVAVLQSKGIKISEKESEAVHIAILLHDIGHGPFSHVLEHAVVEGISHEEISILFMERLNEEFNGKLSLALEIFKDNYSKKFLHQLVSSQLDMDRLDYLRRDSFFSGVTEGVIGSDRIIKMLHVSGDQLVVESKGIYSIEKFLIARRLMYWQVYLHKTAVVAENMLVNVLRRAKYLLKKNEDIFGTPHLLFFMKHEISLDSFIRDESVLQKFAMLDDCDIMSAIKVWTLHDDFVLSTLSKAIINRDLMKIELRNDAFDVERSSKIKKRIQEEYSLKEDEIDFFVNEKVLENHTYTLTGENINILFSDGTLKDVSEASDILNHDVLGKNVKKSVLIYPKFLKDWAQNL